MKYLSLALLLFILSCGYQLKEDTCETFYNTEIKPLEFSKAEVVKRYEKNGFTYLDLKKADNKIFSFTLKNYDKSNFIKKVQIGHYVSKTKNDLVLQRIVVYNDGAGADVFRHVLVCN
jgi:hypothetical protein